MPFGPASLLGVERFSDESEAPLELLPGDDDAKKEQIIRKVYQQVLEEFEDSVLFLEDPYSAGMREVQ